MKRFVSLVLCLVLLFCLALTASAAVLPIPSSPKANVSTSVDLLGGSYSGYKKNGLASGSGTLTWDNCRYEGNFKKGYPYGSGIFYFTNGTYIKGDDWDWGIEICDSWVPERQGAEMHYTGLMLDGEFCGYGMLDFKAGGTFEGEFINGDPDGWGIYTYRELPSNGDCVKESDEWITVHEEYRQKNTYSGLKIGKKWQGFGIGILKSGYCYCGEILNDYRDGYGQLYTKKDVMERHGIYKKGNIKETFPK